PICRRRHDRAVGGDVGQVDGHAALRERAAAAVLDGQLVVLVRGHGHLARAAPEEARRGRAMQTGDVVAVLDGYANEATLWVGRAAVLRSARRRTAGTAQNEKD